MKKNFGRKILLSCISALFVLSTAATSTYAWFQLNSEAWLSDVNLDVNQDKGILISIDNKNYSQKIDSLDIMKAIVAKKNNYALVDGVFKDGDVVVDRQTFLDEYKLMTLNSVTSLNGTTFKNVFEYNNTNQEIDLSDPNLNNHYYEFDLYFTVTTTGKNPTENENGLEDVTIMFLNETKSLSANGTLNKTAITSDFEEVTLLNKLTTYKYVDDVLEIVNKNGNDKISVSTADAMRFSTTTYNEEEKTKIYELNSGLGSYATTMASGDQNYDPKYDSSLNAGYTYLKNINNHYTSILPMDYDLLPKTYKTLDEDADSQIVDVCKYDVNTQTYSKQKVTFRIWLEGYDADCFNGMGQESVKIQLSFTMKKD